MDLSNLSAPGEPRVDGLLGADFFRSRVVQINRAARKICLLDSADAAPGDSLPVSVRNGAICARVAVDGLAPQWLRLDTGCSSALEWSGETPGQAKRGGTSVGVQRGTDRASGEVSITIGGEHVESVPLHRHAAGIFSGESGLLGNGFLKRYTVTFDLPHNRVYLARSAAAS